MKADLHLHSEYSWDSKVPINLYIEKAEEIGFGAISITDHNNNQSHDEIKKLQPKTDVLLIPGQEISTLDGHLLIYGWIDLVERDLTMQETITRVKQLSGNKLLKCVAAHPFDRLRGGKGKKILKTGIDGIEVLNGSTLLNYYNNKALKSVTKDNLIKLANSDAHRLSEFGVAWNELPRVDTVDEFLAIMITGNPMGNIIGIRKKTLRFVRRKFGRMTS